MIPFRFEPIEHRYTLLDGTELPHITGLLEWSGLVNPQFYTEESRIRGTAVHDLCAAYDHQALTLDGCRSDYKPYLLAHAAAMAMLKPEVIAVEMPMVHPTHLYGGRLDRVFRLSGLRGVWETKSGAREKSHQVQTALQAMLDSVECGIPPENLGRWCCYLKPNGKFSVEVHDNKQDFSEARRILRDFAGRP